MREEQDNLQAFQLPESILVISLSEAAAPSESLVWMLTERAVAQISQRIEVMALPLQAPALLKMRSLSPSLKKLLATSERAALVAGLHIDVPDQPVIHRVHGSHRTRGNIIPAPVGGFGTTGQLTDHTTSERIPFSQPMPKPWAKETAVPLIHTLHAGGELRTMPVWLEDDLPCDGLDFLGIPLPAAESSDWMLPQLGAEFPVVVEAIAKILWPIVRAVAPSQLGESAG